MKPKAVFWLVLMLAALAVLTGPAASNATPAATLAWELVLPGLPTRIWRSPHYETDHTLFVTTDRDLRRTADDGDTWTPLYPTPPVTEALGISALALDPAAPVSSTLFLARNLPAGLSEVYRSSDGGQVWTTVFTTAAGPLRDLAAARDGDGHLVTYAVGGWAQVWRSTDGGDTWTLPAAGLPDDYEVYRIFASPNFATDSTLYLTGFGPLVRSTDGGDTWARVDIPWVDVARQVVFSSRYADDSTLWVSFFWLEGHGEYPPNGVVRSTDRGSTWQSVSDGLPVGYLDGWIMGLDVSPDYPADPALYAVERALRPLGPTWHLYRSPTGGDGWRWQGAAPDEMPAGLLIAARDLIFLPTTAGLWRLRMACWEWVVNGDCEDDAGWAMPVTPVTAGYSTTQAHGNSRSIRIGIVDGENRLAYSSARQQVTLPATAVTVTLTAWLYTTSTEAQLVARLPQALETVAPSTVVDAQYVLVLDENLVELGRLLWTRQNNRTWEPYAFDLGAYAGKTIWLHFGVSNDGLGGVTGMYVDDVSLSACELHSRPPLARRLFLPLMMQDWQAASPPSGPLLIDGAWASRVVGHPQSATTYALTPLGLHRSDDGARTWALMTSSPPATRSLVLAPAQSDVLYAGEGRPCYQQSADAPMWKSMDGGKTWFELAAGLNLEPLAVHPADSQRLYARGCDGPWRSADGGATWVHQADDLFLTYDVLHVAPAPADDWQTVYLGCATEGGGGGIIGSRNGGANWDLLTPLGADVWWVSALAVDPVSPTHVYFGEPHAFWGSADAGATWFTSTAGLEEVVYSPGMAVTQTYGLLSLAYVPSEPHAWLLGTVHGLYGSAERGQTWTRLTGPSWQDERIIGLLLSASEPGRLFVTTPAGVYAHYLNGFP